MDVPQIAAPPLWNSLEIVKLLVSALTPISILTVSAILSSRANTAARKRQEVEKAQAAATTRYSKVVEKRVELWDRIGPALNDIYAYNIYVGNWNNLKSDDIIRIKRDCDRSFFAYRPFFSQAFIDAYDGFMSASFAMYGGMGEDAKIRTSGYFRKDAASPRFTGVSNQDGVHQAYSHVLEVASQELGVTAAPLAKRQPFEGG